MTLTIESIEQYLNDHPEAMNALRLKSDQDGETISFADRRAQILAEKLSQTEEKLADLIEISKTNERLFHACKQCLLDVVAATAIDSLGDIIHQSLGDQFDVDAAQLFLYGQSKPEQPSSVEFSTMDDLKVKLGGLFPSDGPRLGAIRPEEAQTIFPDAKVLIGSAALVPLGDSGQPVGLFCLGSTKGDHFHSRLGTHFLELLADVICWKTLGHR